MTAAAAPLLCTVASYRDPYIAELARTVLESEDIAAHLQFENHILLNWMISNALGGVRLQVLSSEASRAREILGEDREELLASIAESEIALEPGDLCPHCNSESIRRDSLERTTKCLALLVTTAVAPFPFAVGRFLWRCEDCGNSFRVPDSERHWQAMTLTHPPALLWYLASLLKETLLDATGVGDALARFFGASQRCWSCGGRFGDEDGTCPQCGIDLPAIGLYKKYVVVGHEYSAACPDCHLPYHPADYAPGPESPR